MTEVTYLEAVREGLAGALRDDERVFLLGEDIGHFGGAFGVTAGLYDEFGPERVLDTPIAEMGFTGAAVGAAMSGLRPVVEVMFVDLVGCCYDQIMNQAAKMHYMTGGQVAMPLTIRMAYGLRTVPGQTRGGGSAAQHSQTMYWCWRTSRG